MDGEITTEVSLENEHLGNYMIIGGGNHGLYNVVCIEDYGEKNYTLMKKIFKAEKEHNLVCGGQLAVFEDEICVSIDTVGIVAEYYYQSQDMYEKWR